MRCLKLLSTVIILLMAMTVSSQTVITYAKHAPQIGQTVSLKALYSSGAPLSVDPGPAGTNVTWNFSTFVGNEDESVSFIDPAQTPFADSISETVNLAIEIADEEDSGYAYFTSTQQNLTVDGYGIMMEGVPLMYNEYNPAPMQMVFPFAYGDSYQTYGQMEFGFEGMQSINKMWSTITADAWGTLTNPTGTYENVLRIKVETIDSTFIYYNGILFNKDGYQSLDYAWYWNDHRYMIHSVYGDLVNGNFEAYGVEYLTEESANVADKKPLTVNVYPNPAAEVLNIQAPEGDYVLSDMLGRRVLEFKALQHSGTSVDVSALPEGMYLLQRYNTGVHTESVKIMIKR